MYQMRECCRHPSHDRDPNPNSDPPKPVSLANFPVGKTLELCLGFKKFKF